MPVCHWPTARWRCSGQKFATTKSPKPKSMYRIITFSSGTEIWNMPEVGNNLTTTVRTPLVGSLRSMPRAASTKDSAELHPRVVGRYVPQGDILVAPGTGTLFPLLLHHCFTLSPTSSFAPRRRRRSHSLCETLIPCSTREATTSRHYRFHCPLAMVRYT